MGTYATTTGITPFMVGVTIDANSTNLLTGCIRWAEAEVNRMLAKRYDVSAFSTSIPLIVQMSEELALGQFYVHNSRGGKDGRARGDELIARVRKQLEELAAGKSELVDSSGSPVSDRSNRGVLSNTEDYDPTFAEDDELNWKVDADKLDDISTTRD